MRSLITRLGMVLATILCLSISCTSLASGHTSFKVSTRWISTEKVEVIIEAKIDRDWHLYSAFQSADAASKVVPFEIQSRTDKAVLAGKHTEDGKLQTMFEKTFKVNVNYYERKATFKQIVNLKGSLDKFTLNLYGQNCDDEACQPIDLDVEVPLDYKDKGYIALLNAKADKALTGGKEPAAAPSTTTDPTTIPAVATPSTDAKDSSKDNSDNKSAAAEPTKGDKSGDTSTELVPPSLDDPSMNIPNEPARSPLELFLLGLTLGLPAVFTPCLYPMIPLTISIFTKQAGRKGAIVRALGFGLSIIAIYVALGYLITGLFGVQSLNELSTNAVVNLVFFGVFILFALSFFGAFDITLPSKFSNWSDKQSSRGGFLGPFFAALTLVIVSFSCTIPFAGSMLYESTKGNHLGPLMGMGGFATALSLPFVLAAMFPAMLTSLPKSGGWMNSVKVVFGFVELAMAFKFLSNVDLAYHWGFLKREIFLGIWIVISFLTGMYLLGAFKLPHDSDTKRVGVLRLMFATVALFLGVYMIPGLFGAPTSMLSGVLPPAHYKEWKTNSMGSFTGGGTAGTAATANEIKPKLTYGLEAPNGLNVFFDYDEALSAAKAANKPLMLDFTGHACANCRRMEDNVWSIPEIDALIRNEYIVLSLYADDRTKLPKEKIFYSETLKTEVNTLGRWVADLQAKRYKTNSQPFYVLLDHKEQLLNLPVGTTEANAYREFLQKGIDVFKARGSSAGAVSTATPSK